MTADGDGTVRWLLDSTVDLLADLDQAGDDATRSLAARLRASVVRPLQPASDIASDHDRTDHDDPAELPPSSEPVGPAGSGSAVQLGYRLWELARSATKLRWQQPDVPGLGEAVAALQDLALGRPDETSRTTRIDELTALQAGVAQQVRRCPTVPIW